MVKIKPFTFTNSKSFKIATKVFVGSAIVGGAFISSCGGSANTSSTQGVITYLVEVDTNEFKITNERVISRKEDSKIITTNLDGTIDTLNLDQARYADTTTTRGRHYRRTFYGGMFGYMIGRSMSSPLNRTSYSSNSTYSRSSTTSSNLRTTGFRSSISKPSKGFGSGKSFKSFGG